MRRFSIRAVLVIALATAAVPAVASAEDRPFKASLAGNAVLSPTDNVCVLRNNESGDGNATYLGHFEWESEEFADFCATPGGVAVLGSFVMTAANGDELYGVYTTLGEFDAAGNLIIHGTYEFDGGTGRFAGASGSGDIDALGFLTPGLPVFGTFTGTIDY
jgi:hypothetical protein